MKKRVVLLLAGLLTVVMVGGCGKKENQTEEQNSQEQSSQEQTSSTENQEENEDEEFGYLLLKDVTVEDYVTVGEYKGLEISYPSKEEFTQEDVDALALSVYQGLVTAEHGGITDRAAENGDTVNINYEGKKDGVAFGGGTAENQQLLLGSGQFIDGFEAGLVGVKPGETVDLNLTFPDPYQNNPDLAGQPVVFTVKVNFIYPKEAAEMTDDAVAAGGAEEYGTVQELKDFCREYLELQMQDAYEAGKEQSALMALMEVAEISEVPVGLHDRYYRSIYDMLVMQAARYGVDADTFCGHFYGVDAVTYADSYADQSARQSMVVQHIANIEDLNVTDEELEQKLAEYAEENKTTVEEIRGADDDDMLKEFFMFEKVLKFLIDNGVTTEITE